MNRVKMIYAAAMLCTASLLPSVVWAGGRDSQAATRPGVSFRMASARAADGFTAMTSDDGVTVFVSSKALFSSGDVAAIRMINGKAGTAMELALPSRVSDLLTSTIRAGKSDQIAIIQGKKLIAVGRVDLDSGSLPRVVGLSARGAERISRMIKRVAPQRATATVSIVPRKTKGKPGDTFTVDVYVNGVSAIMTYQFSLGATGGVSGKLKRTTGSIEKTRGDYLFGGKQSIAAVDEMNGRFGGVTMQGTSDAKTPKYVGTYSFRASHDAAGEFNIGVNRTVDSFISGTTAPDYPFRSTGATITVSR